MMIEDLRGKAVLITGGTVPRRQDFEPTRSIEALMHEPDARRFLEEHFA